MMTPTCPCCHTPINTRCSYCLDGYHTHDGGRCTLDAPTLEETSARLWHAARDLYLARNEGEILIGQTRQGTVLLSYDAMTAEYTATAADVLIFCAGRKAARLLLADVYAVAA